LRTKDHGDIDPLSLKRRVHPLTDVFLCSIHIFLLTSYLEQRNLWGSGTLKLQWLQCLSHALAKCSGDSVCLTLWQIAVVTVSVSRSGKLQWLQCLSHALAKCSGYCVCLTLWQSAVATLSVSRSGKVQWRQCLSHAQATHDIRVILEGQIDHTVQGGS
jgi:hypothetical protein